MRKFTASSSFWILGHLLMLRTALLRCCWCRYSSLAGAGSFAKEELRKLESGVRARRVALVLPGPETEKHSALPHPRRTLALLLGWASSSPSAVAKYASLYTKVGVPALCISPHVTHVWFSALGAKLARSVLHALDTSLEEPASIILHSFSGGAISILPFMAEDFESSERKLTGKLAPKCIVFDSGPADFSFASGMAGAKLMRSQGGFNTPTYLAAIATGVMINIAIGKHKRAELQRTLSSPLLHIPQLYLHSERDEASPPHWVEQVKKGQRDRDRDVMSHCWKDLEHVRLYIGDPETYEKQIYNLLKKCSF